MSGKVFIVTGASAGIGLEVARALCEAGHDVIMACRSEDKTMKAIEKIKKKLPNALASYMNLDLANLESVRKFVDEFHATGKKLNVLINNAGLGLNFKDTKRQYTKDNFEITMGTNHLGHFLLTNLLLDDLKKTAASEDGEARVVVVSSSIHDPEATKKWMGTVQNLDLDDLFLAKENSFTGGQAYKNSKAANLMFAYELSRRLSETNVKVNAVCPGFVPNTELMRNSGKATKFFCRYVLRFTKMTKTIQQAGSAIVTLATDEKFKDVTGKFFKDGQEAKSSEETLDETKQKKLWQLSGGYTKLEGYEPIEVPPPPVETKPVEAEKKPEEPTAESADAGSEVPLVNGVKQTVEEVKTEVQEITTGVVEQVQKDVNHEIAEVEKQAVDVQKGVTEKIETGITDLKIKTDEIIEKVESTVKDTIKDTLGSLVSDAPAQETPVKAEE